MYNLLAYLLYGILTYWVVIRVGWICFRNGRLYLEAALEDVLLAGTVNKLLLTGYYLVNLGYITLMIWYWERISNFSELVASVSEKSGGVVLLLAILHYINLGAIYLFRKRRSLVNNDIHSS